MHKEASLINEGSLLSLSMLGSFTGKITFLVEK